MLLMVEKGRRGKVCHAIYRCVKANIKYMKNYNKNKELLYLKYWDVNNLYGWAMTRKLPVNDLRLVEDISEFDESLIKSCNEESDDVYFL